VRVSVIEQDGFEKQNVFLMRNEVD
jgi:hypothetical protein